MSIAQFQILNICDEPIAPAESTYRIKRFFMIIMWAGSHLV